MNEFNFNADAMALKKFKAMIFVAESEGRECSLDLQIANYCDALLSRNAELQAWHDAVMKMSERGTLRDVIGSVVRLQPLAGETP